MAPTAARAQQLLDRVLTTVDGRAITATDLRAATGFGLVGELPTDGPLTAALDALIARHLVLAEVERFPPAEPSATAVGAAERAMRERAGNQLDRLLADTGMDDARLRQEARDTLRIAAYLAERFGSNLPVSEVDVARYYRTHLEEFVRNGQLLTFAEAETEARAQAAAERRQALIDEWLQGLRARANIVVVAP